VIFSGRTPSAIRTRRIDSFRQMTTPIRPSAARMRMRVGPRAAPTNAGAAPDPMLTTVLRPPRSPMQAQARQTSQLFTLCPFVCR